MTAWSLRALFSGLKYFSKPRERAALLRRLIKILDVPRDQQWALHFLRASPALKRQLAELVDELRIQASVGWDEAIATEQRKLEQLLLVAGETTSTGADDRPSLSGETALSLRELHRGVLTLPGHFRAIVSSGSKSAYEVVDVFAVAAQSVPVQTREDIFSYMPSSLLVERVVRQVLGAGPFSRSLVRELGFRSVLVAQFPHPIGSPHRPELGRSVELAACLALLGSLLGWRFEDEPPVVVGRLDMTESDFRTLAASFRDAVHEETVDPGSERSRHQEREPPPARVIGDASDEAPVHGPIPSDRIKVRRVEDYPQKLQALLSTLSEGQAESPSTTVLVPEENRAESGPAEDELVESVRKRGGHFSFVRSIADGVRCVSHLLDQSAFNGWTHPGSIRNSVLLAALTFLIVAERLLVGEYLSDPFMQDRHTLLQYGMLTSIGALAPAAALGISAWHMARSPRPGKAFLVTASAFFLATAAAYLFWWGVDILPPWGVATPSFAGTGGARTRPFDVGKDLLGWYFLVAFFVFFPALQRLGRSLSILRHLAAGRFHALSPMDGHDVHREKRSIVLISSHQRLGMLASSLALPLVLVYHFTPDIYAALNNGHNVVLVVHVLFQIVLPGAVGFAFLGWVRHLEQGLLAERD